jgi:putative oxidoreductase
MSADLGLLTLRLGACLMMLTHGIPKLQRVLAGNFSFGDPLGIGAVPSLFLVVFAEVVCVAAVLVGFRVRWAAVPVVVTMAVAAFVANAGEPFGEKELALLYGTAFLTLALTGGGRHSLDAKLAGRAPKPRRS